MASSRATRRVDLDSPIHSTRTTPLAQGGFANMAIASWTSTTSEWQRPRRTSPLGTGLRQMRVSPPPQVLWRDTDSFVANHGGAGGGQRAYRSRPLQAGDLYLGRQRPDPTETAYDEHVCSICFSLKSHPVS
jgi:hypothetical protein